MNAAEKTFPEVSFDTSRFGRLTVAEDRVISFVQGVPGFEKLRRFILIDHDAEGVFRWLQAVEDSAVAFLLTDPTRFRPGYTVPLRRSEADLLGVKDADSLITLVMVCVSHESRDLSLNLKGPVVFNAENMKAIQCVLDSEDCPSHFPIKM
ncbi:Flagellar assembly factor FliW [Anaerolineae bacterium]|nr:Flagellar assembly factor FliW [Anaerolineae bacterium]